MTLDTCFVSTRDPPTCGVMLRRFMLRCERRSCARLAMGRIRGFGREAMVVSGDTNDENG